MSPPTRNPDSTSHSSTDNRPLTPPGKPSPNIKAPDAAAFEFSHPIRRTKLKTKRATLLTAVANSETRIAALKENGTEPTLSRAARRSALNRAHLDRVRAQGKLQRLLRKNREYFRLIDGAARKAGRRAGSGPGARQQTEPAEEIEEAEPAEPAEDAGQEGTTLVFRPKP
jgi:hypothetical protein